MIQGVVMMRTGKPGIILGLTRENIAMMQAGRPVHVDGQQLGLPVEVVILYGETPQALIEQLRGSGLDVPDVTRMPEPGERVVLRAKCEWAPGCDKNAVWVRETQFSGKHHYCDEHARLQDDFGKEDPSYFVWRRLD